MSGDEADNPSAIAMMAIGQSLLWFDPNSTKVAEYDVHHK